MNNMLINNAITYIDETELSGLVSKSGETEAALRSGFTTIIASLFLTLGRQSKTQLDTSIQQVKLLYIDKDHRQYQPPLSTDENILARYEVYDLQVLKNLLGEHIDKTIDVLSNYLHLTNQSVEGLFHLLLPAIYKSIFFTEDNVSKYYDLLQEHETEFVEAIPTSIALSLFGVSNSDNPKLKQENYSSKKEFGSEHEMLEPQKEPKSSSHLIDPVKDVVLNDTYNLSTHQQVKATQNDHSEVSQPTFYHSQKTVNKYAKISYWWLLVLALLIIILLMYGRGCAANQHLSYIG